MSSYCEQHGTTVRKGCLCCASAVKDRHDESMEGGEGYGKSEEKRRQEKVLTEAQVQALKDLHRKVKGSYLQLTQLLDELDLLMRTV